MTFSAETVPRRVTPHPREFLADTLTPLAVYQRLGALSAERFLFESVSGGEQVSRFSLLGARPREIYRLYADRLERERGGVREALPGAPLTALREVVAAYRSEPSPGPLSVPFTGGFVGYFGYDVIRLVERLPDQPPDPFGLPLAWLGRFDTVVLFDHAYQRVLAIANEVEGERSRDEAQADLDELERLLAGQGGAGGTRVERSHLERRPTSARPSLSGEDYRAAVAVAQEHIFAGDIFQVVLARRYRVPRRLEPMALYRALRRINPSPYMVLLEMPEVALVGASPEMLVKKVGARLETRPIAGTRPRGADAAEDRRLAAELLADAKERAEHTMLVDLGRNDLGRICLPGTVEVASFMEVERYSHVMHMVSSVVGTLDEERFPGSVGALEALLSTLPAGTVSGAPKIRAMEIIDQLEPESRGPYAGAVGYLSYTGDLDTCITIRTLVVTAEETSVTAGGGIVADSDPAAEQRESENKAAALLAAVDLAERLA
jgi:anthranilate synthase component I